MIIYMLGAIGLILHFLGKWKETTMPFNQWVSSKDSVIYWITSLLFCAIAMIMVDEWAPATGMSPHTYALVVCYGGGHFISRLLNMNTAAALRRAKNDADGVQQ